MTGAKSIEWVRTPLCLPKYLPHIASVPTPHASAIDHDGKMTRQAILTQVEYDGHGTSASPWRL